MRLVEGENIKASYLCLSHCWGQTQQQLMTTTQNISDHMNGIQWGSIPRTFRDAIEVTRTLGIQYLWIDSLCIIQNDGDDWATQSRVMATIYGNAFLTIAATTAKKSSEGLFAEPNSRLPRTHELSSPPGTRVFAHRDNSHNFLKEMQGEPSPDLYPLHTRGWTLQEHLLSPRILHFGPDEIHWECNETLSCCCDNPDTNGGMKLFFAEGFGGLLTKNYVGRDLEACWHAVVTLYTSRQLTVESDKFAAISGLAQKWRPMSSPGYVAGMWKNDLLYSLTWYSSNPKHCRRTDKYRAPSWSWVS